MDESRVGIRNLEMQSSHYHRKVKAGETVIITETVTLIRKIVPTVRQAIAALPLLERTRFSRSIITWQGIPFTHSAASRAMSFGGGHCKSGPRSDCAGVSPESAAADAGCQVCQ